MICGSCKDAGVANRAGAPGIAYSYHIACVNNCTDPNDEACYIENGRGGTWCDCQHKTGKGWIPDELVASDPAVPVAEIHIGESSDQDTSDALVVNSSG